MDEQLLQRIQSLYGIKIFSTRPVRDIYRLETDQGYLCCKGVDYKIEKFLYIYYATEHLLKNGFDLVPAYIHTLTGDPYFTYNNQIYFLTEWIRGREANLSNLVDLELAMITLAKMHKAALGFKPSKSIRLKSRQGKWVKRYRKRMEDLQAYKAMVELKLEKTTFDRYFLKHVDSRIKECEEAARLLEEANYEEQAKLSKKAGGFCHNDYVYHNVMINDAEPQAYIIDFDYCRHDIRVYDLARAIRRIVKDKEHGDDILDVVLTAYNSVYPLEKEEYRILAAFLQFPQRFWRIADRYYNGKRDWSARKFHKRLKSCIRRQRYQKKLVKEILNHVHKN